MLLRTAIPRSFGVPGVCIHPGVHCFGTFQFDDVSLADRWADSIRTRMALAVEQIRRMRPSRRRARFATMLRASGMAPASLFPFNVRS